MKDNKFRQVQLYMSPATYDLIKVKATEIGIPLSKIIAIAVDNELDAPEPFNYLCNLPTGAFIKHAYVDEAQKLSKYLQGFPSGSSLETLMLHRRDIGIPDRHNLMCAYRELLEADMLEEVDPPDKSKKYYRPDYKYIKLVDAPVRVKLPPKKTRLQKLEEAVEAEKKAAERRAAWYAKKKGKTNVTTGN